APSVRALENQAISEDVPADAFRIESYAQGELSDIGRDPIGNPELLQEFLDRHIVLADLRSRECELEEELRQNSAVLIPLEASAAQLPAKVRELAEIDTKLRLAETGKLKDLVTFQSRIAAEKSIATTLRELQRQYAAGVSLAKWRHDFDGIVATAGSPTGDATTTALLGEARSLVEETNRYTTEEDTRISKGLDERASRLQDTLKKLDARHRDFDRDVTAKVAGFQQQGLTGDLAGLNILLTRRSTLSGESARIKAQSAELTELHTRRQALLSELRAVRGDIGKRRKAQLAPVNKQLRETIDDYAINVYYEPGGMRAAYCSFVLDVMRGTYFQEDAARTMCKKISPGQLVDAVRRGDNATLEQVAGATFAPQILARFRTLQTIHALEVISTPDKPVIKVVTKGSDPKQIPANQLSDGQKHTILLTIALLAESNLPLVIDQPEDDLDNAFISSSVVRTLRAVKERRQVIVVTHNANIAVLGDSELILPMARSENRGQISERGSIDRKQTSNAVQNILEGGRDAFRRRNAIYGY
ncbi:MAG: AAA family ATPase, partial [Thermoanaerobaculia bacterium]